MSQAGDGSASTATMSAAVSAADSAFLHPSVLGRPPSAMVNGSSSAGAAGSGTGPGGASKLMVKLGGKLVAGVGSDPAKKSEAGGSGVKGEHGKDKGKAKARVDWTPAQVEQLDLHELGRHWGPQLFSLQEVIQRAVAQVFGELQLVAETAPSLVDFERKKRLIDYVIHSRRQIIKLLVLVKWSANSPMAHKVISIVEFLERQNKQFADAVEMLHQSKNSFYTARLRNYDIPYALRVLTHGRPPLPLMLSETFGDRPDLTSAEVLEALVKVESAMRFRLAIQEVLPAEMRHYSIGDGKVKFRVDGLFEATMTFSGSADDETAIWYLLSVSFLFPVTGPRGTDYNAQPAGAMREQILMFGNQELAGPPPTEQQPDPKPPERPLVRIFVFLRALALNYQLEALFAQASLLDRTAWAGNISATIPHDRKALRIEYWTRARPTPAPARGARRPAVPPPPRSAINIAIASPPSAVTSSRILSVLDGDDDALRPLRLQVSWDPSADIGPPSSEAVASLQFEPGKLGLGDLLSRVALLHADTLVRRAQSQLRAPLNGDTPAFAELELEPGEGTDHARAVRARMQEDGATVEVAVDQFSGRYTLRALGGVKSEATNSVLKRAAESINEYPEALAELLVRVRSTILIEEVESLGATLGLPNIRRLPVDLSAILGVGPSGAARAVTFFSLPHAPLHYLAVLVTERGVRCSLLSLREPPALASKAAMLQLGHMLDLKTPSQGKASLFALTRPQLREVYHACSARVAYNCIARQLVSRRIPIKFVPSSTAADDAPAPDPIPSLCIPTRAVLRSGRAEAIYGTMRVRVGRAEVPQSPLVLFDLRVKDPRAFATASSLSEGEFDDETGRVVWEAPFTSRCVDDMLDWLEEVQGHLAVEAG